MPIKSHEKSPNERGLSEKNGRKHKTKAASAQLYHLLPVRPTAQTRINLCFLDVRVLNPFHRHSGDFPVNDFQL
jgi:hypothetical protein